MAKRNNNIASLLIQLEALCNTPQQKNRVSQIEKEMKIHSLVLRKKIVNKELYAVLHLTRGLDSSLKLFLEIHNILGPDHSLGEYLKRLVNHNSTNINKLKESTRSRFQNEIVDKRNLYMHSSGQFPNSNDVDDIHSRICNCLQSVLLLTKT